MSKITSAVELGQRKVQVFREPKKEYPELWLAVHCEGESPRENALFAELFARARCYKARDIDDADIVVFGGGADVNPALYGETKHALTRFDDARDMRDMEVYEKCYKDGIPMVGVCRGMQFLHVMQGGKLYQDVDLHMGDHGIYVVNDKKIINASSVHHQMVIRNDQMEVIAESGKATKRWRNRTDYVEGQLQDVEAFFYRDICALGVQGHPEYRGYPDFACWFLEAIQQYIVNCPDIYNKKNRYRIKPDILEQRQSAVAKELN